LLFARVDIGVTEFPTKTAGKEEKTYLGLIFFFQKWVRIALEFFMFLAAGKLTFLGWV